MDLGTYANGIIPASFVKMPLALTVVFAIWAAVGPLVGIFIGSYLSRSAQKKQWLAVERIKEWRELLEAMNRSMLVGAKPNPGNDISIEEEIYRSEMNTREVIATRLLIAREVRHWKIHAKWSEAVRKSHLDLDDGSFGRTMGDIQFLIEEACRKDIENI